MKLIGTIFALLVLMTVDVSVSEESVQRSAEWVYVDLIPHSRSFLYKGTTPEGRFRFKRLGGTVEPWTPDIIIESGKRSDVTLLRVVRPIEGAIEVRASSVAEPVRLEVGDRFTASTNFVEFQPKDTDSEVRPLFVEVGECFQFDPEGHKFIITEAGADSAVLVRADEEGAKPITFQRHPRPQKPNKPE